MIQIGLKLNRYVKGVSVINNNMEKFIFNIIFLSFGALIFFYLLILGNMVRNIAERQSFEINARALTTEVRNLEVTYLSMSNNIDLAYSYSLGFKNTQATFATRKALGLFSVPDSVKLVQNGL